ncbi:2346_t:CDS:2, partial [Cetraspora pellucida]
LENVFEKVLEDDNLGGRVQFYAEVIDKSAYLTGLQTRTDRNGVTQEVMFIKNNFAEVERFIQDEGEAVEEGDQQNQNNTGNNNQTNNPPPGGGERAIMTDEEHNNLYQRTKGALIDELTKKVNEIIDPVSKVTAGSYLRKGVEINPGDNEVTKNSRKAFAQK